MCLHLSSSLLSLLYQHPCLFPSGTAPGLGNLLSSRTACLSLVTAHQGGLPHRLSQHATALWGPRSGAPWSLVPGLLLQPPASLSPRPSLAAARTLHSLPACPCPATSSRAQFPGGPCRGSAGATSSTTVSVSVLAWIGRGLCAGANEGLAPWTLCPGITRCWSHFGKTFGSPFN